MAEKKLFLWLLTGLMAATFAACSDKDGPLDKDEPAICPVDTITPVDTVIDPVNPPEPPATPVAAEPFEVTLSFVDSRGNDLLDPAHPATLVGTPIFYETTAMGGLRVIPDENGQPIASTGLRYITVNSPTPDASNDYGRQLTIDWAEGTHCDIISVTDPDSLGQRMMRVNGSAPRVMDGAPVVLRSDDKGFYYHPLEIPFIIADKQDRMIKNPQVTAIIDGKEYQCDAEPRDSLTIYALMGLTGLFINRFQIAVSEPDIQFTGLRHPKTTYWFSGKKLQGYEDLVVLGDFPRNEPLDIPVTFRIKATSSSDPVDIDVRITNTIRQIADYQQSQVNVFIDGKESRPDSFNGCYWLRVE